MNSNNDVVRNVIQVATRMDAAQKTNPKSVNQNQIEELLSYKMAASLLLTDNPCASGTNMYEL